MYSYDLWISSIRNTNDSALPNNSQFTILQHIPSITKAFHYYRIESRLTSDQIAFQFKLIGIDKFRLIEIL